MSFFRGDHIVPNFEEIWPSKKGKKDRPKRGIEYYQDAMMNGPELSGQLFFIRHTQPFELKSRNLFRVKVHMINYFNHDF